jgi:hypothetical protein
MSAFGNNLIERLRTRLVGVQPQIGRRLDCPCEEFEYQRERENGATGRAVVLYLFFADIALKWPTTEILFDR